MKQSQQNKQNQPATLHSKTEIQAFYAGPLPPAQELQIYEQACPGAADRILAMAESENRHRHVKENRALNGMLWNERLGMISAFIICLAAIGGGIYCIYRGQTIAGSFISAIPLGGIVIAFIRGRKHNINI